MLNGHELVPPEPGRIFQHGFFLRVELYPSRSIRSNLSLPLTAETSRQASLSSLAEVSVSPRTEGNRIGPSYSSASLTAQKNHFGSNLPDCQTPVVSNHLQQPIILSLADHVGTAGPQRIKPNIVVDRFRRPISLDVLIPDDGQADSDGIKINIPTAELYSDLTSRWELQIEVTIPA